MRFGSVIHMYSGKNLQIFFLRTAFVYLKQFHHLFNDDSPSISFGSLPFLHNSFGVVTVYRTRVGSSIGSKMTCNIDFALKSCCWRKINDPLAPFSTRGLRKFTDICVFQMNSK